MAHLFGSLPSALSKTRTLILVTGMHRSGTSVLTRVLHLLGAGLGDDLLPAEAGINERGFWEHKHLLSINERLLEALEHTWYDFRPLPENWLKNPFIETLHAEATDFLRQELGNAPLAAIKDPRLCLLLPFWESAASNAGFIPKVVLATRDPSEVAGSLCRRDPLVFQAALMLWLEYSLQAEHDSRGMQRAVVDYATLLSDWRSTVRTLADALEIQWPADPDQAGDAIDRAVDPSLKHQHRNATEKGSSLLSLAEEVHRTLNHSTLDPARMDELRDRFRTLQADCRELTDALAGSTRKLFRLNNELQSLGSAHQQALTTLDKRDRQLEARTREWQQFGKELEYCRSVVTERDEQLQKLTRERDEQLQKLTREYEELVSHPMIRVVRKLFMRDRDETDR